MKSIDNLDMYIYDFKGIVDTLLYVSKEAKRLDVNTQEYYIQGMTHKDMVEMRELIMSMKIPSINLSLDMINNSDNENVVNTINISQIPVKVNGIWEDNKIGRITFQINVKNKTNEYIHITSSSKHNGTKDFSVLDNQDYDIEIYEDFFIASLAPGTTLYSVYLCSISLPFCSMFIFSEEIVLDSGIPTSMFKITMKSIPYTLIEILNIKQLLQVI